LTGMPWDEKPKSRDDAIAVLRRAIELGVDHIDTASFYFTPVRSANELISTALQPYPEDLVITTKVGPGRSRDGEFAFARPDQLRGQVEENIRQLGLDHLDVVNLRWGAGMGKEPGSVAEHFGALADLREAGLIRHLGISNVPRVPLHFVEDSLFRVTGDLTHQGPARTVGQRADSGALDVVTQNQASAHSINVRHTAQYRVQLAPEARLADHAEGDVGEPIPCDQGAPGLAQSVHIGCLRTFCCFIRVSCKGPFLRFT
jgi:aryl-alcohol dehydrogenase-like predicted oxidoreductase